MGKKDDRIEQLSDEELEKEAKKIQEEIEKDQSLLNVHVTKEMDERMLQKIQEYQKQETDSPEDTTFQKKIIFNGKDKITRWRVKKRSSNRKQPKIPISKNP